MTENQDEERTGEDKGKAEGGGDRGGTQSSLEEAAPASPEERIAALTAERDEYKDRMLRIAADFENWKKRARKEQTDAAATARETLLRDLLEVVDNLERATTAYAPKTAKGEGKQNGKDVGKGDGKVDGAAVLQGVNLVLRLFQAKLERYDVRAFESKGQPFDPRLHEAVSQVPAQDAAPGTVANEFQKGYRVGDKLLRPAVVAVAAPPKDGATPPSPSDGAGAGDKGEGPA
jgi:molecular chaperone GrpE